MKLKGRNGETGCQVTPAPPTSGSQRDITAPSSHRGAPRAPFCPDPEVPALVGVGCVSCPASRLGSPLHALNKTSDELNYLNSGPSVWPSSRLKVAVGGKVSDHHVSR